MFTTLKLYTAYVTSVSLLIFGDGFGACRTAGYSFPKRLNKFEKKEGEGLGLYYGTAGKFI